jgi:outer membrane protein
MKRLLNIVLLVGFLLSTTAVGAQTYKFGHISAQEIVVLMPEYQKASDSLNSVKAKYDDQAEKIQVEINKKYNDLVENQNKLDSLILESMYSELQSMQERLQTFQQNANQKLRTLESNLLESVMGKLEVAIADVAKEMKLIYVFDVSGRNPIYVSDQSIDIGPMVKEKLGIN